MSIIVTGVNEESQGLKVHVKIKVIWIYANFNVRKCITNPGSLQSQFDLKKTLSVKSLLIHEFYVINGIHKSLFKS